MGGLSGSRGNYSIDELALVVSHVDKFDAETKPFEDVGDLSIQPNGLTGVGSDVKFQTLANWYLGDRIDITSTDTYVADPGAPFARCKLELNLF